MKNLFVCLVATVCISGCAMVSAPVSGMISTSVKAPITATSNAQGSKEGTSVCKSILGLFAFGDCSVEAAVIDGQISEISTIDAKSFSILGIYSSYTTIVTGE